MRAKKLLILLATCLSACVSIPTEDPSFEHPQCGCIQHSVHAGDATYKRVTIIKKYDGRVDIMFTDFADTRIYTVSESEVKNICLGHPIVGRESLAPSITAEHRR